MPEFLKQFGTEAQCEAALELFRGSVKVMSHLMFGVLVLAADQLMRLMA